MGPDGSFRGVACGSLDVVIYRKSDAVSTPLRESMNSFSALVERNVHGAFRREGLMPPSPEAGAKLKAG